jgi:hypothetical protein
MAPRSRIGKILWEVTPGAASIPAPGTVESISYENSLFSQNRPKRRIVTVFVTAGKSLQPTPANLDMVWDRMNLTAASEGRTHPTVFLDSSSCLMIYESILTPREISDKIIARREAVRKNCLLWNS